MTVVEAGETIRRGMSVNEFGKDLDIGKRIGGGWGRVLFFGRLKKSQSKATLNVSGAGREG